MVGGCNYRQRRGGGGVNAGRAQISLTSVLTVADAVTPHAGLAGVLFTVDDHGDNGEDGETVGLSGGNGVAGGDEGRKREERNEFKVKCVGFIFSRRRRSKESVRAKGRSGRLSGFQRVGMSAAGLAFPRLSGGYSSKQAQVRTVL